MLVLVFKLIRFDDVGGDQPGNEGARSQEWLQQIHAGVTKCQTEVFLKCVIRGMQDVVHDRNRGKDDSQAVCHLRERL